MEDRVVIKDFAGLVTEVKTTAIFLPVCMLGSNVTAVLITVSVVWALNTIDEYTDDWEVCVRLAETCSQSLNSRTEYLNIAVAISSGNGYKGEMDDWSLWSVNEPVCTPWRTREGEITHQAGPKGAPEACNSGPTWQELTCLHVGRKPLYMSLFSFSLFPIP